MNTYAYVQYSETEASWFELVDSVTVDKVEELANKFQTSLAHQIMGGRQGIDVNMADRFVQQYIRNIFNWNGEDRVLLINRKRGTSFLDDTKTILRICKSKYFPEDEENVGISGWLSPEGEFHQCEHGSHDKFAKEIMSQSRDDLHTMKYVSMGGIGFNQELYSHLSVPVGGYTTEQLDWLNDNEKFLDVEQKRLFQDCKGEK